MDRAPIAQARPTLAAMRPAPRPLSPLTSHASRACADCDARFVPGDLPEHAYRVERGAFGLLYICPDCAEVTR